LIHWRWDLPRIAAKGYNLVLNAVKATRDVTGRPCEVRVATARAPAGGVRLDVIDTGVGLRPEEIGRIFNAFYTNKAQGMGIGLSMSKTIVESHGGTLGARANAGPGTTLSVWLPATSA
jgi:signal transduction histidine kinase